MALPLVVTAGIGALLSGLIGVIVTHAGRLLFAFGVTMMTLKGIETVVGYIIQDIQQISGMIGGGVSGDLARALLELAAYAGLFDVINLLISGYVAVASISAFRVFMGRAAKP